MNDEQKVAALTWLMSHAKHGRLDDTMPEDSRSYLTHLLGEHLGVLTDIDAPPETPDIVVIPDAMITKPVRVEAVEPAKPVDTDRTPDTAPIQHFIDDGYKVRFSHKPSEYDIGNTLFKQFEEDFWTNGYPNWRNTHGRVDEVSNIDENVVIRDPMDNLPSFRARIVDGMSRGLAVTSNQFGPEGISDRDMIFSFEYMTPQAEHVIYHPRLNRPNGMYFGGGHWNMFTKAVRESMRKSMAKGDGPGLLSGGGKIYPGSSSIRTAVSAIPAADVKRGDMSRGGRYFNWCYLQQYLNTEGYQGRAFCNRHNVTWTGNHGQWNRVDTRIKLNDPVKRDGIIQIYVNGALVDTSVPLQIVSSWDQTFDGIGKLFEHFRAIGEEHIYWRNYFALGR